ncbi:MAG: hypothetical protein ABSG02_04725 [Terriglobales bacterium]|jgi:hypothetical protein
MHQLAGWLSSNTTTLSILGAAAAFIVSTIQQIIQRRDERAERQFQAFHKIVEQVVSPEPKGGLHYVDRQAAVIFELRHFPRYYDFTERMLKRLKGKWVADPQPHSDVLIEEIDPALRHIQHSK